MLSEECIRYTQQDFGLNPRYERNLNLIRNELVILARTGNVPPFEYLNMLNSKAFSDEIFDELLGYLFFVRLTHNNIANEAKRSRDSVYTALSQSLGIDALQTLRSKNYNKALADWVLNSHEVT